MLRLDHVWRTYRVGDSEVAALRDVSLTIADDDFVAIVGPSGSGKSTLLQILGLLDSPTSGRVLLNNQDLAGLSFGLSLRDIHRHADGARCLS